MAKGFDVLHVKSAVKSHNKMRLDSAHLTTMEFGQILPLYNRELIPGDKFNVKGTYFSRMAPLVRPTYGKFSFKTVGAFVPYHQVADDAEAFMAGKTVWQGNTTHHRYFTVLSLINVFANYNYGLSTLTGATANNCDFGWISGSGQPTYILFTPLGRYAYKILTSLGYALSQNFDNQTNSYWRTNIGPKHLSAYPLLAFAKLYNDYMSQSQRFNTSSLTSMLHNIKHSVSITNKFNGATGEISELGIVDILKAIRLCYENDYFTSAWQQPNTPLNSPESVATMSVPETGSISDDLIRSVSKNTYLESDMINQGDYTIAQRSLDFLKSFDDWVKRNNYSGSREVQQIYSRFGIKTDDYRSNYAHIIYTDEVPISVGDVTSMASNASETLGDYAGKGIMAGEKSLNFVSSDFGMLFILGYFTVRPMNSFGFDKSVLRSNPLDYYNPEFDGLGAEAISFGELYSDPTLPTETVLNPTQDDSVFGFTERYNSYRFARDRITGLFRNYHPNADDNTWHTGRYLTSIRGAGNMVAQSTAMNTLEPVDSEYNRIFSITAGFVDHFYLTCNFFVEAVRPILSLNQAPRLGEGDTVVPRNGNEIS